MFSSVWGLLNDSEMLFYVQYYGHYFKTTPIVVYWIYCSLPALIVDEAQMMIMDGFCSQWGAQPLVVNGVMIGFVLALWYTLQLCMQ